MYILHVNNLKISMLQFSLNVGILDTLNILFLFNTLQYSVVCLYYLHCFQFLAFMNNAIIIICMNFSRGYIFLFLSKEYLWMELLEKVSFHSNPNEKQCQRMFKLLHNCVHLTCQLEKEMATHSSVLAWRIAGSDSDTTDTTQQQQQHMLAK